MENILKKYNVSRETSCDLQSYDRALHEWQCKFNLVSDASLPDSWNRHICDSVQLFQYLPKDAKVLYDFGSGAGFPGMVLAIMAKYETPYLKVKLVESIKKKTLYLKHVSELTKTPVGIINERIENVKPEPADVITARALTSLDKLLGYSRRFTHKGSKLLFLKGKKHKEEIIEAQKHWKFNCEIIPSQESSDGVILSITDLKEKK